MKEMPHPESGLPPDPLRMMGQPPVWAPRNEAGCTLQALVASRCRECGFHNFPASGLCPSCLSLAVQAVPLSGEGTLYSFTTVRRNKQSAYAGYVDLPEQIRIFALLAGFTGDAPPLCDLPVRIRWLPAEESAAQPSAQKFVFERARAQEA